MTSRTETKPTIVAQNGDDFPNTPIIRPVHGSRWGDWVLNLEPEDDPSLDYVGRWYRNNPYWIRLSELQTWHGLNHWMHHLNEKNWGRESMGDFVNAVMDISRLSYPEEPLQLVAHIRIRKNKATGKTSIRKIELNTQ